MFLVPGRAFALGLVLVSGAFAWQQGDGPLVVELDDQALGRQTPILPAEPWRPLDAELVLAGRRFAVAHGERSRLSIDTNADGRPDRRITGMGDVVHLRQRGEDDQDDFHYWVNIERAGAGWRWAPAGARVGRAAGVALTIVDLDGDGAYGGYGTDALLVGRSRSASLLSRVVHLQGRLYDFVLSEDATSARLQPHAGPVARLDVTSAFVCRGELTSAVFASGEISFELSRYAEPPEVPIGEYRFVSGMVARGAELARIAPGRMPPVALGPGERHVIGWGGPLVGEFGMRRRGAMLTILPDVGFFGQAGEEYRQFEPAARAPRIEVRDRRTGDLLQYGCLGGRCGAGFSACVLDVPKDAEIEVSLSHRRALFGEIAGRPR